MGFKSKSWGCKLEIPPDFLAYGINRGELLAFAAERVISLVDNRTDLGLDYKGSPFKRPLWARPKIAVTGDEPIMRDARGRWTKESAKRIIRDKFGRWTEIQIEIPGGVYTLRSNKVVRHGGRMRDNLRFSPAFPKPDARTVWVFPQGGRDGFAHAGRAKTLRANAYEWLELIPRETARINADIARVPPTAWLDTHRKNRVAWNIKKAQAAEKTIRRAMKKHDETAAARAQARHDKHVADLARMGVAYEVKPAPNTGRPKGSRTKRPG